MSKLSNVKKTGGGGKKELEKFLFIRTNSLLMIIGVTDLLWLM